MRVQYGYLGVFPCICLMSDLNISNYTQQCFHQSKYSMIHNRDGKKGGEQSKKYKQTDVQRREREKRRKYTLECFSKGEQLEGSDTGWNGTACRLLLIVNGRASLLWQLEPKWSLTALSGSLSGSVAGQESGWFHPFHLQIADVRSSKPPW